MNRPISRRMHGMLDYPAGLLLIAAPWIFGFSDVGGAAVAVPIVIGAVVLLQSVMTDYEFGLAKVIPMRGHLTMDVLAGAVLAVSPFAFGFSDEGTNAWLPHVIAGLGLIAAGAMTDPERASGSPVHERGPYTASR